MPQNNSGPLGRSPRLRFAPLGVGVYNGKRWSPMRHIDPRYRFRNGLLSVSCASRQFCMAIDGHGHAMTGTA